MNIFVTVTCFALVATAAANPGYNYNQPRPIAKQNVRPQSGVFSAQQSLPLPAFNVQPPAQHQPIRQNFIAAPAPAPAPQYAPPQQYSQQQQAPSQLYSPPATHIAAPAPQYIPPIQQAASHSTTFAAGPSGSPQVQYNQQAQQQAPQISAPAPQYIPPVPQPAGHAPTFAAGPSVSTQVQYNQQAQQHAPQIAAPAPQYIPPIPQAAGHAPTFAAGPSGAAQAQYNQQAQQQVLITKDIYIHSAPEENEEINSEVGGGDDAPIRKNYRIVFIKAPVHNIRLNVASLNRIQAANEEKTVIYVLTKKPDISNMQSQLSSSQPEAQSHKPEVYFIKYNTQEEANRAQQEIQAQYDALGGSTRVSDEGFAPVTSVIGGGGINGGSGSANLGSTSGNIQSFSGGSNFAQAASNNQQQFAQSSFQGSQGSASATSFAVQTPSNKYLPAKKK